MTITTTLAAMSGVELQQQAHWGMGMNTGIIELQLIQVIDMLENHVGRQSAERAEKVLEIIKTSAKFKC